jgi:pullulanase/glycogen debranching enzyme
MLHSGQEWAENYWIPESTADENSSGISRVSFRPVHWKFHDDGVGRQLMDIYRKLIAIRNDHPALRSANFYPSAWYQPYVNEKGFGFDLEKQVVTYHRWDAHERMTIIINFSENDQSVDIPFPSNGAWNDLLNDQSESINDYWLHNYTVYANWGAIFHQVI